jgi:hypothetical protein
MGLIPLRAKRLETAVRGKLLSFFGRNPIFEPLHSFHSGNPGGQIRTEQTGIRSLKGKSPDRSQTAN